jgi:hypothetical protein
MVCRVWHVTGGVQVKVCDEACDEVCDKVWDEVWELDVIPGRL